MTRTTKQNIKTGLAVTMFLALFVLGNSLEYYWLMEAEKITQSR